VSVVTSEIKDLVSTSSSRYSGYTCNSSCQLYIDMDKLQYAVVVTNKIRICFIGMLIFVSMTFYRI